MKKYIFKLCDAKIKEWRIVGILPRYRVTIRYKNKLYGGIGERQYEAMDNCINDIIKDKIIKK